mmetsp:Transcript_13395/g.21073  ORF Transcript_13395/g.21073 Transcript_13395/m.21073 type:complete len:686 (-) Transcript_13395:146-2203(-)|eukprot:CAMPEP_0117004976 /NCGR_PEP_ID=MMETSP0472-20121206/5766_1 /TAXON_ID=693140 ORGANISM="Tiarina fusus, Strain LIS" /NCGR_SAMPLE_ID=MMETSP0472 /ASSEMBLY_ACC=CAM_ASM_000603 /LENGTH=685 /DNA_ID=CAMNT_0004706103 /DNA_START=139 /DNA_END=2196 /DNA_ORIENTATION=+
MGLTVKLTITHKDDGHIKTEVDSSGKYKRKASWEDLSAFSGQEVNSDLIKDWIYNYQKQNFPEQLEKPNYRPFKCFIFDEPKKGFTLFKDYGWNPIKLELKVGMAEVKKKCTKKVSLVEKFVWEEMEAKLKECADMEVVSTVKKSKLAGHELAVAMMKSTSEITTDFEGFEELGFFMTPTKKEADEIEEESGAEVWKNAKKLGELLEGKPLPKKPEAGTKHEVVAYETSVKTRIYYKAMCTGEVSTDHKEQYDGRRYWNFPLKYLLQYNGVPKQALIYEDVEFKFYTGICVADIEPGLMTFSVKDPEGNIQEIQAKPADTTETVKDKVEQVTGIAMSRQVLKFEDKEMAGGANMQDLGLQEGSSLTLEIFKIPITVKCPDGQVLTLNVEPIDTIETLKKMLEEGTHIKADKQILKLEQEGARSNGAVESNGIKDVSKNGISNGTVDGDCATDSPEGGAGDATVKGNGIKASSKNGTSSGTVNGNGTDASEGAICNGTLKSNGINANSVLILTEDFDPIVFIDIKCNTLFALDRKEVVEKRALTPVDGNEEEFEETMKGKDDRAKILANMNEAPNLGVNPNKVVERTVVQSLGVQELESVRDLWGVNLKTREQNEKGEELYFVDVRTGAAGELLRNKYIKMKFLTPYATAENKEELKETEKDIFTYDKYVGYVRRAFGIEIVPRGV